MNRPLLLGHRGVRGLKSIRENTIAAFDRAIADGCDGFEFDVRLTRDGVAVIWHDTKMRLIKIAHATAAKLSRLPQLQEVLVRYQNTAFLNIELKVAGVEELTVKLLRQHPPRRGCVISSFLPEVLRSLHALDPQIALGMICEKESQLSVWDKLPIDYVMVDRKLVSRDVLEQLKTRSKRVFVWTVNDAEEMQRLAELGLDGIISDKTALLCQTLRPGT
ncbi:MAG TPA: glycerophosphodiester phosphodiesterase [Terriglobales bacterium]|jgi:glycerophosphoryl diester phosphodiesterase|nr:glycerophosphodiester phosphodiesterase [Terriglobales bacterium]